MKTREEAKAELIASLVVNGTVLVVIVIAAFILSAIN